MRLIILLLFATHTLMASGDHGKVVEAYKSNYKEIAVSEMYRSGIPASIKLAQGMLESNWGRSELANTANNHFGIKCGSAWKGGEYYREDDDYNTEGELTKSCFRKFESAHQSYIAHSDFLTDPAKEYRYGFLFNLNTTDYKAWAQGLKDAGYATDPKYPQKLISIIEKYNLHRFDIVLNRSNTYTKSNSKKEDVTAEVAGSPVKIRKKNKRTKSENPSASTHSIIKRNDRMPARHVSKLNYDIVSNNDVRMIVAFGGETIEQLARKIGINVEDLLVYNELYTQKKTF